VCQVRAEVPELYFCSDMKGYGWCFRKGNYLNVGLGRADSHKLPSHVEGFARFLKDTDRVPFELPAFHGHAYLLQGVSRRTVVGDDLLLAGDSAGLAYPQSGEGILPAVHSGLAAAKTIIARNCLRESLETYPRQIAPNEVSCLLGVARSLPSSWIGFLARNLLQTRWFVRKVVLDEWFLHASSS
jgi:menaquinone-9 beta-reductase